MNRNISAIIAEDEPPMGRFIKNAVEQEGVYVCSVCETAEEVITKLSQYQVDLIITDICMPGINGLELIKKIIEVNSQIQFIIVSGYKNFDYAKEAISLGVEEYLTKPIQLDELKNAIEKITANAEHRKMENKIHMYQEAFAKRDNFQLRQLFPYNSCRVLSVFCDEADHNRIRNCIKGVTNYFRYKNTSFVLLGETDNPAENQMTAEIIKKIRNELTSETFASLYIDKVEKDDDFYLVLHSIRNKVRMLTYPGEKNHYDYSGIAAIEAETRAEDDEILRKIYAAFTTKNIERISELIEQLFIEWKQSKASVLYMEKRLRKIVDLTEQYFIPQQGKYYSSEMLTDLFSHIESYEGLGKGLNDCIKKMADEEIKSGNKSNIRSDFQVFQKIINLIEDNQTRNYSLAELSQLFNLSQPYIRSLFKKYTSKNFKNYVLDSKINYAKHLMSENPSIMIKDVASSVGFDQLYFTTVFSKYVGMSPSLFKMEQPEKEN